jgi:ATP sulfurylase
MKDATISSSAVTTPTCGDYYNPFDAQAITKVREMLGRGEAPPEFSRPEVATILMECFQRLDA